MHGIVLVLFIVGGVIETAYTSYLMFDLRRRVARLEKEK
jgi:uncharacterized integral membrane protein